MIFLLQKRHQSDRSINNRPTRVLREGKWVDTLWHQVHTGDTVRVQADEPFPADLFVLSTSEATGQCFIETADLDGYRRFCCQK